MKLKHTFSLDDMYVNRDDKLPIRVDGPNGEVFTLWLREFERQGNVVRKLCSDVVIEVDPPERVRETLHALNENKLLLDDPVQEGLPQTSVGAGTIVDTEGNIKPNYAIDFDLLPKGAKPWLRDKHAELSAKNTTFLRQVRWLQNAAGGHRAVGKVGAYWSEDGVEWFNFPANYTFHLFQPRAIRVEELTTQAMTKLLAENIQEPVSHDLIREAIGLVGSAPRSALLIAFAALETGIKTDLSQLLPDATAIVDKLPSPPLITLLQEVFPEVLRSLGKEPKHFPLAKEAKDYLRKWTAQRNDVTHGRKDKVDTAKVREFILFASDILYLLDAERGEDWAIQHIQTELLRAMFTVA